ncbi:MAG: Rpn family recombination-promoting nuclease/putative transposase, partial [Gemmatimonadetes bacterium]|nr:Rpn family recombination-promoting nuclease/putative transposase [Gemmatimonadota bacterium]
ARSGLDPRGQSVPSSHGCARDSDPPVEGLVRALAPRRDRLVDFASLSRLPAEYVTSQQAPRYGDMLWECRLRTGAVLLIVIEFQSTVDHDMPLRLFEYTARALREWARPSGLGAGDRIPLVLPLLVWPWTSRATGQRIWRRPGP